MAQFNHSKWPELEKYWNEYGMGVPFSQIDGYKSNGDHCIVVRWKNKRGEVEWANLYRINGVYEMINDGGEPMSERQWNTVRVPDYCDWFEVEGKTSWEYKK